MDARVRRRGAFIAVAIAVVAVLGVMAVWRITREPPPPHDGRDDRGSATEPPDDDSMTVPAGARDGAGPSSHPDAISPARANAPIDHTVHGDTALHDDVRARILAAWRDGIAAARNAQPPAADADAAAPGTLEPDYIRSIIRDEFVPMARTCYEQQVERQPGARGRITLAFTILGDPHAGGIVDDVRLDDRDAGAWDDTFRTCMQETMRTMVFRAPTGGGRVTVRYPFALEPDPRDP